MPPPITQISVLYRAFDRQKMKNDHKTAVLFRLVTTYASFFALAAVGQSAVLLISPGFRASPPPTWDTINFLRSYHSRALILKQ